MEKMLREIANSYEHYLYLRDQFGLEKGENRRVGIKKESAALNAPRLTENPLSVTDSTANIAQLLEITRKNKDHPTGGQRNEAT